MQVKSIKLYSHLCGIYVQYFNNEDYNEGVLAISENP